MRIGLVGTGTWSKQTYLNYFSSELAKLNEHNLVSIYSRTKKSIDQFNDLNVYSDFVFMLEKENIEVVCIVSPDDTHYSYIKECLKKNINVIVEKPLVTSLGESNKIKELLNKSKSKILVQYHKRFDQSISLLRNKLINEKVISINLRIFNSKKISQGFFSSKRQLKNGPLDFLGSHMVDILFYIFDTDQIEYVTNSLISKKNIYYKFTLKINNLTYAHIETGWILPQKFPSITMQEIEVFGEKQYIKLDGLDRGFKIIDDTNNEFLNPYFKNEFHEGYGFVCLINCLNYLKQPFKDSRITNIDHAFKNVEIINNIKIDENKIYS